MTGMAGCRKGRLVTLLLTLWLFPAAGQPAEYPRLSLGGFARLQLLAGDLSRNRERSGDSELWIPDIPVDGSQAFEGFRVNTHARESRLWIRALQDTPLGELEALVEGDLDGDRTDGHEPRLRHAYLVLGPLLVGQTYSTFTNTSALADTDSAIAVGNVVTRHRQVRWQQPINESTSFTLAAEDALNRLHYSGSGRITSSGDRRPHDLVLRVDHEGDWGNLSLSMLFREITTTGPRGGVLRSDRDTGSAVSLAGRIATGPLDNLRFMFNYGNALGRYSTLATYADATVTLDGEVALATVSSSLVAWQHFWSSRWRSTFAVSHSRSDPHPATDRQLTRESRSAHANLIWTPTTRYSIGLEYLHGWRSLLDGRDGELHRLQLTTRINF